MDLLVSSLLADTMGTEAVHDDFDPVPVSEPGSVENAFALDRRIPADHLPSEVAQPETTIDGETALPARQKQPRAAESTPPRTARIIPPTFDGTPADADFEQSMMEELALFNSFEEAMTRLSELWHFP